MLINKGIPIYLIAGFLEGGKTEFVNFTMQQDYFNDGEKTLLIVCEEGEPINEVHVEGAICRDPNYRRTPLGREICEALAV